MRIREEERTEWEKEERRHERREALLYYYLVEITDSETINEALKLIDMFDEDSDEYIDEQTKDITDEEEKTEVIRLLNKECIATNKEMIHETLREENKLKN